jgi:hypothetical protein
VWEEGEGWAGDDEIELTDPNGARLRALDAINPSDADSSARIGNATAAAALPRRQSVTTRVRYASL